MISVTITPERRSMLVLHTPSGTKWRAESHLRRACAASGYEWPVGRIEMSGCIAGMHLAALLGILHESGQIKMPDYGRQKGTVRGADVRRNGKPTVTLDEGVTKRYDTTESVPPPP